MLKILTFFFGKSRQNTDITREFQLSFSYIFNSNVNYGGKHYRVNMEITKKKVNFVCNKTPRYRY